MIEVRFGGEEGLLRNDRLYPLINEANGSGVVWAVLNPAYTRLAMRQLAPEVGQFPEAAKLVARMQNMIINVDASSGIEGKFQAVCGSTEDANTLGQLLQAGFLYKRYQAQKDNPDLAQLLDQARVTPAGDRVTPSPSCVSYWTRSNPAKTARMDPVAPICEANPAMVSSPIAGESSPRWHRATSIRSEKRVNVT